ncbi:hypothetical protein MMC07_009104 [Pseudocyphellaria aurata]|nr:hypothetical protein [Pseudocyphellaria aurata]
MSPNDSAGRISKNVFLIIPTILFTLSVVFLLARTTLRLRYQKRLFIDDAFLLFAEICLGASVGLLYAFADNLFLYEALVTRPSAVVLSPDSINQQILLRKQSDACLALTYTSIFAVKFSFLFFFKVLVRRMHRMIVYWWIVVAVTTIAWIVCVMIKIFLPCMDFDKILMSCNQKSDIPTNTGLSAMVDILDMITDILIIMIPVRLLWNVRIERRQKIILGATMCLSTVMVFTAIIRISALRLSNGLIDVVWGIFWQITENCLAVTMVCLSAFRSVFVGTKAQAKQPPNRQWYVLSKQPQNTRKRRNWIETETEETEALPEIPRPTMTGLKTFIRGNPRPEERTMTLDESNDQNTLRDGRTPTQIRVDYSISHETDETTNGNQQSRAS